MKSFHCCFYLFLFLSETLLLSAYDFVYHAGNITGSHGQNGYSYTLSVTKGNLGTSYNFDTRSGVTSGSPSNMNISVTSASATGVVHYAENAPPAGNFTISMSGLLIPPEGETDGSQPSWFGDGNAIAPYRISSNQDGGAKDIVVPAGASVTYTAYEGNSTKASNWTVNGQTKNNESSIIFNRNWWDVPGWFSALGTPDPGMYNISARPPDRPGVSDSGSMTVVGIASISGHGKSSSRSTPPDNWTDTEIIYAQPKSVINLTINLDPVVTPDDNLKASISWSVSGMFTTITPNESKLGATFIPDSTGSYIVTASCGQSQRLICIKVVAPKIYSVSFGGNIQILKDTGGSYSGVAWQDNDLDGSSDLSEANADSSKKYQPVAYCSTATMSATSVFKLNYKDSQGNYVTYDAEAVVKKLRFAPYLDLNDWSTPVNFNMDGTEVTAASPFKPSSQVGYYECYKLAWEVGFGEAGTTDSNLSWERCYTEHELYLTLNATKSSYETVFHIGCISANGSSSSSQVVSSIWSKFSSKNVRRKGDSVLFKYWNPKESTPQRLDLMLQDANANGSCIAWSQFFKEALNVQFSSGAQIYEITPISGSSFLVKNWKFGTHISPGADGILNSTATGDDIVESVVIFPGPNGVLDSSASGDDIIKDGIFIDNTHLYLVGFDVIDQEGIPGQGNANPPGIFSNHFIVRYSGVYYDPSYGSGGFPSSTAHEEASIDGICSVLFSLEVAKKKGTSVELSYTPTSL